MEGFDPLNMPKSPVDGPVVVDDDNAEGNKTENKAETIEDKYSFDNVNAELLKNIGKSEYAEQAKAGVIKELREKWDEMQEKLLKARHEGFVRRGAIQLRG